MHHFHSNSSSALAKAANEPLAIFVSISVIQIVFSLIGIVASITFIMIVLCNHSIHTLANVLTCNSSIAVLILASDTFCIAAYVLYRDLSPTKVEMSGMFLCQLRGYISHTSFCALVHSFVIQAFHRLAGIVYHNRLYYQSLRPYTYAISIQWVIAVVQNLPIVITNSQIFIEEEYLCQISIQNSFAILYVCTVVYFIPLPLILIQYWIIAMYSKRQNEGELLY